MNARPTSVTVISWILIVIGGISAVTTVSMMNNPVAIELMNKSPIPIPLQYVISFVGMLVMIVSGFAMLKGLNWARLLYVAWSVIGLLIGAATSPMKMMLLPGIVFLAIIIFFLFRPKANEFFSLAGTATDA